MSFKDTIREHDVPQVFINQDEFATEHVIGFTSIDGVKLPCVFDEAQDAGPGKVEGVFRRTFILFIQENLLKKKPAPDARMIIDKVWYLVTFIESDNFGMCEIHLERMQQ